MKVPPHVLRLYVKTARRYKKIFARLHRETVSPYERKTFLHKLRKLLRTLRELEAQLKIAAATGTIVLMLNANVAQAQTSEQTAALGPFVKQNRANNPLREPIFTGEDTRPTIAVVDHDGDGDMDVVVGEYSNYDDGSGGRLRYFENKSSEGKHLYLELFDDENPFNEVHAATYEVSPAFADLDGDGDMDLFLGQNGSYVDYDNQSWRGIEYYRNDDGVYTRQTGAWDSASKEGNPFDGISLGEYVRPSFSDFDNDGDTDLVIGSTMDLGTYPYYERKHIHYYENDGSANFTAQEWTLDSSPEQYYYRPLSPAVADLDGDGDKDLVIGNYYDTELLYYKQVSPGNFERQWDEWDPLARTGNPFQQFQVAANASPAFIDFNNDGMLDLFVADDDGNYGYKYSDNIIHYYQNSSNSIFVEKHYFDNPFDGVYVKEYASPILADLDEDGDLDALIGNKYDGSYYDYQQEEWIYSRSTATPFLKGQDGYAAVPDQDDPFNGIEIYSNFVPQLADVDGDGDDDLISSDFYGVVRYFVNNAGEYSEETESSPFADISLPNYTAAKLVDIDNDNDLDLFLANRWNELNFYRNTGTAQEPVYELLPPEENPLDTLTYYSYYDTPYIHITDIDHDGDLDVLSNGTEAYYSPYEYTYYRNAYILLENTGTPESPEFKTVHLDLFPEIGDESNVQTFMNDYDGDGDLDMFVGNQDGTVSYLENQNNKVVTTITATSLEYVDGDEAILLAPDLTLEDEDNDYIVKATVSIENYVAGETLAFTPHANIIGVFDSGTGVLTFGGKTTSDDFQEVLRTVTFKTDYQGRRKNNKSTIAKSVSFAVFDQDFTNPQIRSRSVNVFVNDPPAVSSQIVSVPIGGSITFDLKDIISDPDGVGDLDLASLKVTNGPSSGASATIDANGILTLDYGVLNFAGTETLTVEVCDMHGACAQNILTLEVDVFNGVVVYNAVAPNSSGDNRFMRITGLPAQHKVTIFNRWGDKVYDTDHYDPSGAGNAFKGSNNSGAALSSGTYYYTIEIPGQKLISGYLTLKQ